MSQVIKAQATFKAQTIVKLESGTIEVRNEKGEAVKNTKGALTLIAEALKFEFDKTKINTRSLGSKLIGLINPKPAKGEKITIKKDKGGKGIKSIKIESEPAKAPKTPAKKLLGKDGDGKEVFEGDFIGWKADREESGKVIGRKGNEFKVEVEDDMTNEISIDWVEKSRSWSEEN